MVKNASKMPKNYKEVLGKYEKGRAIASEDFDILKACGNVGLVHFGYCFSRMEPQASLTNLGKQLVALPQRRICA